MGEWGNDYNKTMRLFEDVDLAYLLERIEKLKLLKLHLDLNGWGMY